MKVDKGVKLTAGEKETGRVEAFSDGVFAIAITLLVIDLKVPHPTSDALGGLAEALIEQWPAYLAFLTSFSTILIMWVNHHNLYNLIHKVDGAFLFLNGLVLLTVSFVPFPTSLLAEHIKCEYSGTASLVYAGTFFLNCLSFNLLWIYSSGGWRLVRKDLDEKVIKTIKRNGYVGLAFYLIAMAASFFSAAVSVAICIVLAVFYSFVGALKHLESDKGILAALMLSIALIGFSVSNVSAEDMEINRDYIKEHYPDVYEQIFKEGMEAARNAQDKPAEIKTEAPAAEAEKRDLGDWWNKSSLHYDPIPSEWLYRFEFKYSLMKYSGNTESYAHLIYTRVDTRKNRYTNSIAFTMDTSRTDIDLLNYHLKKDQLIIEDTLKYDITKELYGNVGFIWEKNSILLIDSRYAYYGGLGYRLLTLENHKLDALLVYGYLTEKYTSDIEKLLDFRKRDFDTIFFNQTYDWNVTKNITFIEKLRWIHCLNKRERFKLDTSGNIVSDGEHNRNLIIFIVGIDAKITDNISLSNSYQINYDDIPWPGVKKKDTMLSTGIKVTFQ